MSLAQHDHIVLLVDTPFFENLPEWVTKNFTVVPGGYHDGQASRNKLIIFADGTYLEFFNWYDKPPPLDNEKLPMRFWGPKPPGLIDFAITNTNHSAEQSVSAVNQRLSQGPDRDADLGVEFGNPQAGSREKADGTEVRWKVTRPNFLRGEKTPSGDLFPNGRIDVPFFCHDVTERTSRVPFEDEKKTTHPCGAIGIAACEVLVPEHLLAEYATVYSKILGSEARPSVNQKSYTLDIGGPLRAVRSKVIVRAAETEIDITRMNERGIGFSDLVLATSCRGPDGTILAGVRPLGSNGIESTIWLEKWRRPNIYEGKW